MENAINSSMAAECIQQKRLKGKRKKGKKKREMKFKTQDYVHKPGNWKLWEEKTREIWKLTRDAKAEWP